MPALSKLRTACLPFVTRTFRGNRLRRAIALSGLVGVLTVVISLWISFGAGPFEREVRQALGLERPIHIREHAEFVVIADGVEAYDTLVRHARDLELTPPGGTGDSEANRPRSGSYKRVPNRVRTQYTDGLRTLEDAVFSDAPPVHHALQRRARQQLAAARLLHADAFSWDRTQDVLRLRAIVETQLFPRDLERLDLPEIHDGLAHEDLASDDGRARHILAIAALREAPGLYHDLQAEAWELLMLGRSNPYGRSQSSGFSWSRGRDLTRLESIVDAQLVPHVELYRSPAGFRSSMSIMGLLAGTVVSLLLLIAAPLLAGAQTAQEVHENTLQPLTGTLLTPTGLVIGMMSGPLALAGLLAVPTAAVFVGATAAAGTVLAGLAFLAFTLIVSGLITALAQLAGLGLGRRRAPGVVGVGLLVALGAAWIAGLGAGASGADDTIAASIPLLPQSGSSFLLRETFVPAPNLSSGDYWAIGLRLVGAALVFASLTAITVAALRQRVTGRFGPSLRRPEGFIAAGLLIVCAAMATTADGGRASDLLIINVGLLVPPLMLVLMGRVPTGEAPAARRHVAIKGLLLEFAGYFALQGLVAMLVLDGSWRFGAMVAVGAAYLAWTLAVAALLAMRVAAVRFTVAGGTWVGICLSAAILTFFAGAMFCLDRNPSAPMLLMSELSPVLGASQFAAMVWIPWSLVRSLRKEA